MKVNVSVRTPIRYSDHSHPSKDEIQSFEQHEVSHKLAFELMKLFDSEGGCMIKEDNDGFAITRRYEVIVFTPEDFKKFVRDLQLNLERGYPMVI